VSIYLLFMELMVAYRDDPAGYNMAKSITKNLENDNGVFHGKNFDLAIISTPSISADWLEEKFHYDGFIFLSKHASESGTLALTCHSTGNFDIASFGGNPKQIAIPHPNFQKTYLKNLSNGHESFPDFQITIEATHHGPTSLEKPCIFIEIGTTEKQWNDTELCNSVSKVILKTIENPIQNYPFAICFGGNHYSKKFSNELINGKFALGTVVPKHALDFVDKLLFLHIMNRNNGAKAALLDWNGLGKNKQRIIDFLTTTNLEIIKL